MAAVTICSPGLAYCVAKYLALENKMTLFSRFSVLWVSKDFRELRANFDLIIDSSSMSFSGGSVVKNPLVNAGDMGLIPSSGRSPGEGNGNPLQYSCLEDPRDRGAW